MDGSELDVTERVYAAVTEHREVARKLVEQVQPIWSELPADRFIEVGAVSAFEALRRPTALKPSKMDFVYIGFLLFTLAMPLIVVSVPDLFRTLAWDALGIGSTMFLLLVTYGFYVYKMIGRFSKTAFAVFQYPPPVSRSRRRKRGVERDILGERGELSSFVNVSLAGAGAYFGLHAIYNVYAIYKILLKIQYIRFVSMKSTICETSISCQNKYLDLLGKILDKYTIHMHHLYGHFFSFVWLLSIAFVAMDLAVAIFDDRHEETFIAASSAAHATIPMCIGIGMMWIFIQLDPDEAHITLASGALTFQMIMSNILFILIKKNLVFRFLYNTVRTTRRFGRQELSDVGGVKPAA